MGNVTKQASTRFSIVKRSKGQSAVEKASYISRSVLVSEFDGQTYRPKYHEDLVHSEITLPPNAPKEYADRATLWNAVELSEKGQKSQLARMLKASLPNEWSYELAEEVVRDYVQRNFVGKGMCADWAIQATHKESQSLKGFAKMKYDKEHKDSLSKYPELKERMQSLLQNGEKITPKQWKAEIQSLQSEYDSIGKEQTKTATELAYAEVISYNRKNLERELQNESRQHDRQQVRPKRREKEI